MKRHISTYSAGSVDLPWPQDGTDIEQSASVTTNPTPKQSSKSIGPKSHATKTYEKYEANYTQESLFSPEDSHANHSQSQVSNEVRMTTVTSGLKCCELYKKQSQLGSLVRMLLGSSTWRSTKCALIWKVKVTKSNRSLFQLAPLTRRTEEIESGLWPTPREGSEEGYMTRAARKGHKVAISYLETRVDYLKNFAPRMWPTPSANEDAAGTTNGNMQKMLGNHPEIRGTTPEEWKRGSLNPTWVAWLMGYPTEWLNCVDSEMPLSRKSRQKSSDVSTK
jgi:DNA (cytosine-5)-methyltransferase 1